MISVIITLESAFIAAMAARRKRAATINSLNPKPPDPVPVKLLTRGLSRQTQMTTPLQQMIARHVTAFIRNFVGTGAFDQLVLSAVARIRSQLLKKGGRYQVIVTPSSRGSFLAGVAFWSLVWLAATHPKREDVSRLAAISSQA